MSGTPTTMLTPSLHNNLSGRGHGNPSSSHRSCPLEHTRGPENTLHPHHGFTARGERVTQLQTHLRPSRILDFNTRRESGTNIPRPPWEHIPLTRYCKITTQSINTVLETASDKNPLETSSDLQPGWANNTSSQHASVFRASPNYTHHENRFPPSQLFNIVRKSKQIRVSIQWLSTLPQTRPHHKLLL